MKNLAYILFLILMGSCKSPQKKATPLNPIVLKAKETSLYAEKVNWEEVNAKFVALTEGKDSVEELKEGLQYLVNSLGDKHAAFRSAKDHSIIVSYNGKIKKAHPVETDAEFINTVINNISAKFSHQMLGNEVGYLKVVGIGPGDVKEQSDFIRQGLVNLKEKGAKKWILDLRFNGGGNIEPMLSGLAPLLGEGNIGGAINNHNEVRSYKIENGQFNNNGRIVCPMNNLPLIASTEKVAVLLSRYTISSGEMVAIAFKGRENTKFIGEETAGFTTGNGYDQINEDIVMVISQDVFMDRNEIRYEGSVGVDENIEFQHTVDMKNDHQINWALEWMNK